MNPLVVALVVWLVVSVSSGFLAARWLARTADDLHDDWRRPS